MSTKTPSDSYSRGFDAGNYAYVYIDEDLERAFDLSSEEKQEYCTTEESKQAFRVGFVLGFFSSFEEHEIPVEHQDEWRTSSEQSKKFDNR